MSTEALVIGETLVDLIDNYDEDGELIYRPRLGGSPFNVAVGAARLGAPVQLATALGDDTFGVQARNFLTAEGVDISLSQTTRYGTCLAVVTTEQGQATYEYFGDWDSMTDIAPLPSDALQAAGLVHAGSTAMNKDPVQSTVLDAFRQARGYKTVDPNPRPALIPHLDSYRRYLLALFSLVDLIKLSKEDIEFVWPGEGVHGAAGRLTEQFKVVLMVTQADADTLVYRQGNAVSVPVPSVSVADPTGAGDTFMASLISNILSHGAPTDLAGWAEYARVASIAASVTCSRIGGAVSMPTAREVSDQGRKFGQEPGVRNSAGHA